MDGAGVAHGAASGGGEREELAYRLQAGLAACLTMHAPALRKDKVLFVQASPTAPPAAAVNEKELADRLQAGLAKPLGAALRTAVERQLLPSLERAVGEAFRQVGGN